MTAALILLCAICTVLIAMCGWLFGKEKIQSLDIEKLYDAVAQLSTDQANLRKGMAAISDKVEDAAKAQEEAAENISKQIEKKWDSGLQNMLVWNPFERDESEDG